MNRLNQLRRLNLYNNVRTFSGTNLLRNTQTQIQKNQPSSASDVKAPDMKNLSQIQGIYMNKINKRNEERYLREKKLRKHYRITGSLLFAFVLSVYFYTMYAIQQEKFLDDFDVPEPPANKS